jgi:hypothetical protein
MLGPVREHDEHEEAQREFVMRAVDAFDKCR